MRIKELDVFRGFAAMAVVLYHYTTRYNKLFDSSYSINLQYGWLGVPVFFILSGFVIYQTVNKSKDAFDFLKKRFIRLYPTFWICLLITLGVEVTTGYFISDISTKDILMNFTMFHNFFGFNHIDGAYWSLLPELLFYLLMAFLMMTRKVKDYYLFNGILLFIGLVHLYFPIPIGGKLLAIHYILLFMIGIAFYRIYMNEGKWIDYLYILFNYILSIPLYFAVHQSTSLCFLYVAFGLIILIYYLFVKGYLAFLSNFKVFLFIGNISYALYLIHQNIGYVIINKSEIYLGRGFSILVALITSILLASIITYKIEPIFRLVLRKIIFRDERSEQ